MGIFLLRGLPALLEALRALGRPCEFLVWTDQPALVEGALRAAQAPDLPLVSWTVAPPPGPDRGFMSLSECHREGLRRANGSDRVILLTADMVLSREILATAERHIMRGRRLICCAAPRALESAAPLPRPGLSGRELLGWAWANRHPMTRDCTWPDGNSYDLWRMYFERDGEVAARVFLPHPLVAVPAGRAMPFSPTIDVNLASNFPSSEVVLVTSPEDGAAIELSPADKEYVKSRFTMRERLASEAESCPQLVACMNGRHRMFFERRVIFCGSGGDCGDEEVVRKIAG